MSEAEKQAIVEDGALTAVEKRRETTEQTAGPVGKLRVGSSARPATEGLGQDDNQSAGPDKDNSGAPPFSPALGERMGNEDEGKRKPAALCHHVMESGLYCQSPALRDRRYCYSHLRLRGERLRMARAVAKRQPYHLRLPALDDMAGVRVAVARMADALAAGLLEPQRAGRLIYAVQQVSCALHREAQARMGATSSANPNLSNPILSPKAGDNHPDEGKSGPRWGLRSGGAPAQGGAPAVGGTSTGEQKRLVEEYPEFEAEFGLPAGLDLSQPPHVIFPPPEETWPSAAAGLGASARTVAYDDPPPSCNRWTKEDIEMEELDKRRENMSEKTYSEQARKINERTSKQVQTEMRKQKEAEWQAEADRRNAHEAEKDRIYRAMDDGQRQAYHLGVLTGFEHAQCHAEEEARKKKPVKAVVSG
jgi:hypothetical protein